MIGVPANNRVDGMSAQAYIRQSILEPNAFLAPECPNGPCLPNIMPGDYSRRITVEQLNTLVTFCWSRRPPRLNCQTRHFQGRTGA